MTTLFPLAKTELELRPYQADAIERLRFAVAAGKKPVLSLATGGGKTAVIVEIFRLARAKGKRVAFVVPLISIIAQTWKAFAAIGLESDLSIQQGADRFDEWGDCLTDRSKPIQICSIQTLAKRGFPEADIVVFDEIHILHEAHKEWIAKAKHIVFIGLSATPWRKGLNLLFDELIVAETTKQLIGQGYLSKYRMFAPAHPDLSGVKTTAGDYNVADLGKAMNKAPLVADVVETWLKLGGGRPTFVFCVDCAHAEALQRQFNDAGVPSGYIDAHTTLEAREAILEALRIGELQVVCNIGVLTAGVDAPYVSCIVLARPTKSEMLYIQIVGRGLRIKPQGGDLLILDHSDTATRLGLPDSIVHEDFVVGREATASEKKKPLPKPCAACTFLKPPRTPICPNCGFEAKRVSGVYCDDGELVEIGGEFVGTGNGERVSATHVTLKGVKFTRAEFYQQLKSYQELHGHKTGWTAHKYKEMVGNWPANHFQGLPSRPISPPVHSWLKSRQIAWAKSKKRETKPIAPPNIIAHPLSPDDMDAFARETI